MQNHLKGHDEMDHMPQTVLTTKALAVLLKFCRILTHFSGATNSQRMRVNWGLIGSGARPRMWRHGHRRLLLMVRSTCPQPKTLFWKKSETIGLQKQAHTPNPEKPWGKCFYTLLTAASFCLQCGQFQLPGRAPQPHYTCSQPPLISPPTHNCASSPFPQNDWDPILATQIVIERWLLCNVTFDKDTNVKVKLSLSYLIV